MESLLKFEKTLIPWIGKIAKFGSIYFKETFLEHGMQLSKEQFLVLKKLHETDGRSQNDLAFITDRSKTALTRLITTMEKKELVFRVISKEDKRINHVFLSELGKKTFKEALPVVFKIIDELQSDISQEDIEKTIQVLNQIQKNQSKKIKIN